MKNIAILGSTGSIGVQTLEIVRNFPEEFKVTGLLARGSRLSELHEQVREFGPTLTAVTDSTVDVPSQWLQGDNVFQAFIEELAETTDVFVNGLDGIIGVKPSLYVVKTGKTLALANKESMVCAGKIITQQAQSGQIWPVDSEHSALFQAALAGHHSEIERLVLTASGGPFRKKTRSELQNVSVEEAIAHPTWNMGRLISLNSATLVNKALEVIEAHELFDIDYKKIDVTVHPQSIVHSMVTFCDGTTIAQASPPSMLLPIAYCISQGQRLYNVAPSLDFRNSYQWTFEPVDTQTFPVLDLAKRVGQEGGVYPALFNSASEAAGRLFLDSRIEFLQIVDVTHQAIDALPHDLAVPNPDLEAIEEVMKWGTQFVRACA